MSKKTRLFAILATFLPFTNKHKDPLSARDDNEMLQRLRNNSKRTKHKKGKKK